MALPSLNPFHYLPGPSLNPLNYINPFEILNDYIKDLYQNTGNLIIKIIMHPPRITSREVLDYLLSNELGVAIFIGGIGAILAYIMAMWLVAKIITAAQVLILALLLPVLGSLIFLFTDWVIAGGDQMAAMAGNIYDPSKGASGFQLPGIVNIVGAIFGYGFVVWFGGILIGIFYTYAIITIGIKLIVLVPIVLYPFANWARKLTNILFAAAMTIFVFGRPAAILCLRIGQLGVDKGIGGSDSFGATFYLCTAIFFAAISQIVIFVIFYKTASYVSGKVEAKVTGSVHTSSDPHDHSDHSRFGTPLNPIPVVVAGIASAVGATAGSRESAVAVDNLRSVVEETHPDRPDDS